MCLQSTFFFRLDVACLTGWATSSALSSLSDDMISSSIGVKRCVVGLEVELDAGWMLKMMVRKNLQSDG